MTQSETDRVHRYYRNNRRRGYSPRQAISKARVDAWFDEGTENDLIEALSGLK